MRKLTIQQKKLQGTLEKSRTADKPVEFTILRTDGEYPIYFGERAKSEWDKIINEYKLLGMFSILDVPSLQIYCKAVEDYEKIETDLFYGNADETIETESGYSQISPTVTLKNKAIETILKYGERLGLNPVARTRISGLIAEPKKKDRFTEIFGS